MTKCFTFNVIIWLQDLSHCTDTGFKTLENRHKTLVFKELRNIWDKCDPNLPWPKGDYNESNTLLVDDSPYKALLNPVSSITYFVFLCFRMQMLIYLFLVFSSCPNSCFWICDKLSCSHTQQFSLIHTHTRIKAIIL